MGRKEGSKNLGVTVNCKYCKKDFQAGSKKALYCSDRCNSAYRVRRDTGEKRNCTVCGNEFAVTVIKLKNKFDVCSVDCSNVLKSSRGVKVTISEIEKVISSFESQPSAQVVADTIGTTKTTVIERAKESYGGYRKMLQVLRGSYKGTLVTRNGSTASALFDRLDELWSDGTREYEFKGLISNMSKTSLRVDYYVPSIGLIVEFNGQQHYEFSEHFHVTEERFLQEKSLDDLKEQFIRNHGLSLVIWKYDVPVTLRNIIEVFHPYVIGKGNTEVIQVIKKS